MFPTSSAAWRFFYFQVGVRVSKFSCETHLLYSLPALNHYQSGTSSHPLNNEIGKQAQQGLFANIHLMLKGNRRDRLGLRVGRERQNLGLIFRSLEMHPGGELK